MDSYDAQTRARPAHGLTTQRVDEDRLRSVKYSPSPLPLPSLPPLPSPRAALCSQHRAEQGRGRFHPLSALPALEPEQRQSHQRPARAVQLQPQRLSFFSFSLARSLRSSPSSPHTTSCLLFLSLPSLRSVRCVVLCAHRDEPFECLRVFRTLSFLFCFCEQQQRERVSE